MTSTKTIAIAAALSGLIALSGPSRANEPSAHITMKPFHGVSFDVGAERAVSYFTSERGACKLVVTLAGEPDWDAPKTFSAKRFEASIPSNSATSYAANGETLEFACRDNANMLIVRGITEVAAKTGE